MEEELKKIREALKAAGVDLSKDSVNKALAGLVSEQQEASATSPAAPQSGTNPDLSLTSQPQSSLDPSTRKAVNDAIIKSLTSSAPSGQGPEFRPIRWPSGAVTYERIPNTEPKYGPDSQGRTADQMGYDWGSTDDQLRGNRLDDMAERNKPAQAEAERRDDIRSGAALDIQKNLKEGRTDRGIFGGSDGRVVGPAQLQKELIAGGMNRNDANIAAGQRYRDMFDLPNASSQGFGMRGGQQDAVLKAPPGDRMAIMEELRNARRDNLQELARQRRENPTAAGFSGREVGTVTEIATADGRVLAKRTPEGGGAVVANGRTGTAGALELTDAGERAIRDRTYSMPTDKLGGGTVASGGTVVTGKYGTAIGGVRVGDTLRAQGLKEGTPEWDKARADLLANAGNAARSGGKVDSVAGALTSRMPSGSAEAIDQKWNNYERDQKIAAENKQGNDFLNAYEQAGGKVKKPAPDTPDAVDKRWGQAVRPKESGGLGITDLREAARVAANPSPLEPRTDAEKKAMQGFVNQPPAERSKIVDGLAKPKDELETASKRKKKPPISNI